jgi:hypothetical protein
MSTFELRRQTHAAQPLAAFLQNRGEDDAGVQCALESETNVTELQRAVLQQVLEDATHVASLKELIRTYRARLARVEVREERGLDALRVSLETLGITTLRLPEATLSVSRGRPGVTITDDAVIPLAFRTADPRIMAAWRALMQAASMLAGNGQEGAADTLRARANDLVSLFTVDKKAVMESFREGQQVPGAALSNGTPSLTVRRA